MLKHINHLFPAYTFGAMVFTIALFFYFPIIAKAGFDITQFNDVDFTYKNPSNAYLLGENSFTVYVGYFDIIDIIKSDDFNKFDELFFQVPYYAIRQPGYSFTVNEVKIKATGNYASLYTSIFDNSAYSITFTLNRSEIASLLSFSEQDHCYISVNYNCSGSKIPNGSVSVNDIGHGNLVHIYGITYSYGTTSIENNAIIDSINNNTTSVNNGFNQSHEDSLNIQNSLNNSTNITNDNMNNLNNNLSNSLSGLNEAEAQVYDVATQDLKDFDPNDTFNLTLGAYTVELATLGGWMDKIINNSDGLSIVAVLLIFLALIGLVLSLDLRKGD